MTEHKDKAERLADIVLGQVDDEGDILWSGSPRAMYQGDYKAPSEPCFIQPEWPDEPFNLLAEDGGFEIGPFTKDGFATQPDGTLWWSDGYSHPVQLQVRGQEDDVIHANDGNMGPMTYRIVPVSFYENRDG